MGCASSSNKDPDSLRGGSGGSGDGGDDEEYNPLTTEEVNARIQCCDKPLEHTLGKSGITLRYAYLSQRGYYPVGAVAPRRATAVDAGHVAAAADRCQSDL